MKKFSARNLFKILFVTAIFGLLVFLNPASFFSPLGTFFGKMTHPFEKITYSVSRKIDSFGEFIFSIGQLKDENRRLVGENQELIAENARLHDIERENVFLREQVDLLPREKFDFEPSFVISQDPQGLGNFIEIDKGTDDGLKEGMAVVVSKGIMIGRLEKVSAGSSSVMLLTNPKSAINAIVAQSGAKALAKGEYGLGIMADSILQTDSVSTGNEVVTSGIGGEIPKGLLIGTVQQVRPSPDHLFRQAVVSSPVDVSKLEMVFVVRSVK